MWHTAWQMITKLHHLFEGSTKLKLHETALLHGGGQYIARWTGGGGSGQVLRNFLGGGVLVGVIICYMGGGGIHKLCNAQIAIFWPHSLVDIFHVLNLPDKMTGNVWILCCTSESSSLSDMSGIFIDGCTAVHLATFRGFQTIPILPTNIILWTILLEPTCGKNPP